MIILKVFIIFLLSLSGFAIAEVANSQEQLLIDGKRFRWIGSQHKNHYYYDFNGDKTIDALDVMHPQGVDFYNNRVKGVYHSKYQILHSDKGLEEIAYERKNNKWIKISQRQLGKADKSHLHPKRIDYSQYLPPTVLNGLRCLAQTSKATYWVQKIFSQFKTSHYSDNSRYSNPKVLFKKMLTLAGLKHSRRGDLTHACQQCCMSHNDVGCKVCFSEDLSMTKKESWQNDLASLFIYDDSIDAFKKNETYHSALERVYSRINKPIQVKKLLEFFDGNKDKLLETLFFQYSAHMNKNVNSLSGKAIFYSDMIAELMSKVSCFSQNEKNIADQKKCEVLYLARSIPDSYCLNRKEKSKCRTFVRNRYANRKRKFEQGIRIPANFSLLK